MLGLAGVALIGMVAAGYEAVGARGFAGGRILGAFSLAAVEGGWGWGWVTLPDMVYTVFFFLVVIVAKHKMRRTQFDC